VTIYFAILMVWRFMASKADGMSNGEALSYAAGVIPLAMAAICILLLLAYAYARMTIYSITSKRVMIRSGVAMPITVNLPFKRIDGAGLKLHSDGTGDIPLKLSKYDRIAIMAIWPNMRPWKVAKPEPMLRSLPDAGSVADILAAALSGARIPAVQQGDMSATATLSPSHGLSPVH
jgi:Bacterial PH domain